MAVKVDVSIARNEDAVLAITMAPPVNIAGWNIRFRAQHRFGGLSGFITKSAASGFGGGQSGITIANSGTGAFNVRLNSPDTSGQEYGAYAYTAERMDSGFRTVLTEGYLILSPSCN